MGREETAFTKKIKDYLKSKGIWHVKFFANAYTAIGIPDILACINSKFVGLEIKTDKGKLSKLQEYQGSQIKKSGGYWFCVKPQNFEGIKIEIEKILKGE